MSWSMQVPFNLPPPQHIWGLHTALQNFSDPKGLAPQSMTNDTVMMPQDNFHKNHPAGADLAPVISK